MVTTVPQNKNIHASLCQVRLYTCMQTMLCEDDYSIVPAMTSGLCLCNICLLGTLFLIEEVCITDVYVVMKLVLH